MQDDLSDFKLSPKAKAKLKNLSLLKKELAEGKTAQQIIGFSDKLMDKFYKAAYQLFEHKRYKDAANAFLFLATLNPYVHEYWLALGMASQMSQDYEAAIDAYELAAMCDIKSPVPYLYLAKCLFSIHDRESALQALDLAIETADDIAEYEDLKKEAEEAKSLLLRNLY
ncbi:MAG: SycD/LcrH family type III secretion system chaperone [Parachlamydiaceae bacterium]|nr:SycD/LcrH family type III secretion system chaperone [Parachlamydiaceae bacterium]